MTAIIQHTVVHVTAIIQYKRDSWVILLHFMCEVEDIAVFAWDYYIF